MIVDWMASGWGIIGIVLSCCFFVLIGVVDYKRRVIPNKLIYPALVIVLLFHIFFSEQSLLNTVLGGGFGFVIFYATYLLRPGDLGGGDVKLALLIGLLLGFPAVLWALLLGVGSGGVTAVILLLSNSKNKHQKWSRKSHIPYAPFLCLGAIIALLYNPLPLLLP